MVATVLKDGTEKYCSLSPKFDNLPSYQCYPTLYLALHPPEASLVPILGEVHGPLPLDGEAAAPEQLVPVRVIGEVVEQFQRPVGNVTYIGSSLNH